MAATKLLPPSVSRKSLAAQLLFVVALLLIGRFLWIHYQPERLMVGPAWSAQISGDNMYLFAALHPADMTTSVIEVRSLHGGQRHVLAQEDAHCQFYHQASDGGSSVFAIAEGKLYYAVEPRPSPLRSQPASVNLAVRKGLAQEDVGQFLGQFLLQPGIPADTGAAGQQRIVSPPHPLPTKEAQFRQVSTQGGVPQDAARLRGEGFCLLGSDLFWIRPEQDEKVVITREPAGQRRTYWYEVSARSDLMLTSLKDGTTRCLRHGIPRNTRMTKGEGGVSWEEPAPFPIRPTVFYARTFDGSVRSLGTSSRIDRRRIVEADNRLYWTDSAQSTGHMRLMSANLDGSDIRNVYEGQANHPLDSLLIHAYRGGLYGCLAEAPTSTKHGAVLNQYLCRLPLNRPDPVEILYKLPRNSTVFHFDAGYLYFIRNEDRRSLWASLTNDDSGAESMDTLYRTPLNP